MKKGDAERQLMPQFIEELEKKIQAHNQQAALFSGPELENLTEDLMRNVRKRGEVRLADLEHNASEIEKDVERIRKAFLSWVWAIRFDNIIGILPKADCCPTIGTIYKQYWRS